MILQIHQHEEEAVPNIKEASMWKKSFYNYRLFVAQSKLHPAKRLGTRRRMDALARDGELRTVCAENKGGSTVANPKAKGFCKHLGKGLERASVWTRWLF